MANDKKAGRPIANNVDYFPHKCKDDKELMLIQHKFKSEGYEAFYRLQQCLGDAENHKIDLKNDLEKQMFEMGMSVSQEIVYGVIDILVGMNWLDREVFEKDNVLWSDKFMKSIRAVYINRRRHIPEKKDIYRDSTTRNKSIVENSIEKDSKEEKSKDDKPLSISEYEKLFPEKDLTSLKKYFSFDNPTHAGAIKWSERELKTKPIIFEKTPSGLYKAWCSKCGNREFPDNEWQLKKGSECCRVEYANEKTSIDEQR
tara:strand:+ start:421 stop:1191 length:771 start_codon:yes stop_codon:yes gene_type:complete